MNAAAAGADADVAAPMADVPDAADAAAQVESLAAQGLRERDPAWLHHLQTLARRSTQLQGEAQRFVRARLAGALAQGRARLEAPSATPVPAVKRQGGSESDEGLDGFEGHAGLRGLAALTRRSLGATGAPGPASLRVAAPTAALQEPPLPLEELRTFSAFKSTWTRLRDAQRLAQALAAVPANAGPLHTQRLVLRTLQRMQQSSPAYFHRFLGHLETLQWLEQLAPARPSSASGAARKRASTTAR